MLIRFMEYPPRNGNLKICVLSPREKAQMTGSSPVKSFSVFTCHLYYAPLKSKSGPKFCEFSVNNKRAGPNEVQASSLQKNIRYGKIGHHGQECIEYDK
jgi:hypothetical protein